MEFYTNALAHVLSFGPLTAMIGATLLGVFIGALPGLNPVMAIALLLPLTYSMDPLVALAMVAGIYNGSMYAVRSRRSSCGFPARQPPSPPLSTASRWPTKAKPPRR